MTFLELLEEIFNTDNTNNTNTVSIDDVDFTKVTKEELDETMKYLDEIKKNPIMSLVIPSDDIDEIKAAVQAKWDIAHDEGEGEELPTQDENELPEGVEERLGQLVDEYVDKKLQLTEGSTLGTLIAPYAKSGYLDFARFIYTHK